MVEGVSDLGVPAHFAGLHVFFPQLPAFAVSGGQAGPLGHPHDVVEVLLLEPGDEQGAGEAAIAL
jgi:hypothetical protein